MPLFNLHSDILAQEIIFRIPTQGRGNAENDPPIGYTARALLHQRRIGKDMPVVKEGVLSEGDSGKLLTDRVVFIALWKGQCLTIDEPMVFEKIHA